MTKRCRINFPYPAGGYASAVWDDGSDTDPFDDPLNNLSRVKFHDRLDYIKVIDERVVTVNFSSYSPGKHVAEYTLFAHGRGGTPLVFASTNIGGTDVAFTGSIPVQLTSGPPIGAVRWARWVVVGADATNVYVHEYVAVPSLGYSIGSLSLDIKVWVTDENL